MASTVLGRLSGITVRSERMPTLTHQAAAGRTVLDGAPTRDKSEQGRAKRAAGRGRRPVLGLGIDGAYGPSRPASARGGRGGDTHGATPRAFASLCLMASAWSMGSVGITCTTRRNAVRPSRRAKRPG
jgi:hypothetical protein